MPAGLAAAWLLVRLLGLERGFPLVPLIAYTPYVAFGSLAAALVALVLRRRRAALVAALAGAALLVLVAPRVLPDRGQPEGGARLRVLAVNAFQGAAPPDAIVALAREEGIDVLAVQELTPQLDARLRRAFAYRVVEPRPGTPGTGIYAERPLEARPAPTGTRFPWTRAEVGLPGGGRADVHSVHPVAPLRPGLMREWRRDLRALPAPARTRGAPRRILAGDFNATLDHAELRRVLDTGYRDAAASTGAGLRPTWPSGKRRLPPVTIDHVLADERCAVRRVRVLELRGSDHRAVLADLRC